jgi:hypothetical protein
MLAATTLELVIVSPPPAGHRGLTSLHNRALCAIMETVMKRSTIENTPLTIFVTLLTVLALTPAAKAGIVDSPVPSLGGAKASVLYSVPFVMNAGSLGTYFSCTSTAPSAQQVAVEVFSDLGGAPTNDAVATQLTVGPGETRLFATTGAAGLSEDKSLSSPALFKGSARILSTSKSLICTAFVADTGGVPPRTAWQLTMVAKTKQKGE